MKIVLTGGHLSPALSVMQALPKNTKILFIGRKYALEGDSALSLEYKTITQLKIPFVELNTGRWQRKLTKFTLFSLLKLPFGIIKSFFSLIKFKPDIVVGFGGYVSVPVVLCAYLLRIPVIIHEQTLEAGVANRFLARFAAKICISWQTSQKYFSKDKTILTGNPVRQMANGKWQMANKEKLPIIYITGGSSGSHFINVLIEGCLKEFLERYIVIHQTGDAQEFRDFDRLSKLREDLPAKQRARYILKKFVDPSEIGDLLNKTTLVISRSGMNIVTELLHFEKPALLIPLPFSQNNEQLKNARFLDKLGLGRVLQQTKLNSKKLFQTVMQMFDNIDDYKIKNGFWTSQNDKGKNAAQNIVSVINYAYKAKRTKIF